MKKTTYIIVGIIIVFIVIIGYIMFLFFNEKWIPPSAEAGNASACVELGCSEDDIYVGSVNSDKYYECSCRYAKSINPENIKCFKNDEEALADNRTKSEC